MLQYKNGIPFVCYAIFNSSLLNLACCFTCFLFSATFDHISMSYLTLEVYLRLQHLIFY